MASLGELIKFSKKALECSKAKFERASTMEIEKGQLQEKLEQLKAKQTIWTRSKENLEQKASL